MAHKYLTEAVSPTVTPQSEAIPDTAQVPNSAGGFAWAVDNFTRLERFLILGCEGGSYYASERKLTKENAKAVESCIAQDGLRTVKTIVEISKGGRAPKNDPALFALALCAAKGDPKTREAALAALPAVARIGTHLFHFAEYVQTFRGWGRGLRQAVADWYIEKPVDKLAYQLVKYQSRDQWSHRDLLRLSHAKPKNADQNQAFKWAVKGEATIFVARGEKAPLDIIFAFEQAKAQDVNTAVGLLRVCHLIEQHGLTREMVPTEALAKAEVWEALLQKMPMTAMIRNLATMTRVGLLAPNSEGTRHVLKALADIEAVQKSRVHPIQVLTALMTYKAGRGQRGSNTWTPVQPVVTALDEAFYLAFQNVPKTGLRWYLGLDVSGSMNSGEVAGVLGLTPRMAAAAMAMVTMRSEASHFVAGFTEGSGRSQWSGRFGGRYGAGISELKLTPKMLLDDVAAYTNELPFGGTDCALPMIDALERKMPVDVFVIYTDSETWAWDIHPTQALAQYRQKMGVAAKLIVVGMVANDFTIADPNDAGMLDVVGFDSAAPAVISNFASGRGVMEEPEA